MHLTQFLKRGKHNQYIAAILVNLLSLAAGISMAWTSPVLPRLEDSTYNPFPRDVTPEEAMWTGALVSLGTAIGPFPCAYLSDRFGRKSTLLWSALPAVAGWVLITSANTIVQLLVARLVLGFACSVVFSVVPTYVAEIADDNIRGTLGSLLQVFLTTGMLFTYCVGPYTSYICYSSICGVVPILFLITFVWMPESPYFLLSKGRIEDAMDSLSVFRNKTPAEIEELTKQIKAEVEEAQSNRGTYKELLTSSAQRWPLFIGVGLAAFFQLSGITAVIVYAEIVFEKTSSGISSDIMAIIFGLTQVLICLLTPFIYDRVGRKILLILSAVGMTIALASFGVYFYLSENNIVEERYMVWVPATCIVTYIIMNCIGFGGVIWIVMSEIFPVNLRSQAMAVCTSACFVVAFFIALTFDPLDQLIKSSGTFWLYAAFAALSGLFTALMVPETKGLSFAEIQNKLKRVPVNKVSDNA